MCSFYVYDAKYLPLGLLQNFISVQWVEHYNAVGEVKISAQKTKENLALLASGNKIYSTGSDTVARICDVEIVQSENEHIINARAVLMAGLLGERIIMATENIDNAEMGMYNCYTKNRRELPIKVANTKGFAEKAVTEFSWVPVLDGVMKIAEMSGLGFKVAFNPENHEETFVVYRGTDRCDDKLDTYIGYFGTDVGNVENASIVIGDVDFKNVAIVAGEEPKEEENERRIVRTVSLGNVRGEMRKELFVDAKDLKREYEVANATGEYDENGNPKYEYTKAMYTNNEYNEMLDARGFEKLAECMETFSITCDIVQNNIKYGVDYYLGDRVPIKLVEHGISATARVASVTHVYEIGGEKSGITLSNFKIDQSSMFKVNLTSQKMEG